jgi:signal peptidase II
VSSPRGRAWLRMLAVCGLVLALDQISKGLIRDSLAPGERVDLALGFDLARVTNSGIAFGLLDDSSDAAVLAITIAGLGIVTAWFAVDANRPGLWLGVGLLLGGALGNLADRIRHDGVTDFIDPPLWPAFNLADVSITAGVVVIALIALAQPAKPETAEP